MKLPLTPFAALLLVLPLCACPYETKQPLGDPTAAVRDDRLVGDWLCVAPGEDQEGHLRVDKGPGATYAMTVSGGKDAPTLLEAFINEFPEGHLLQVRERTPDQAEHSWMLVRYTLHRPYLLEMEIAQEEPFKGAADPLSVARKGLAGPGVFDPVFACIRPPQE